MLTAGERNVLGEKFVVERPRCTGITLVLYLNQVSARGCGHLYDYVERLYCYVVHC